MKKSLILTKNKNKSRIVKEKELFAKLRFYENILRN